MNSTLREISQNRSILYDPNVADACDDLFLLGNYEMKRKLLAMVSSNMVLKDRKIASYQLKEPFALFLEGPHIGKTPNWLGRKDSNIARFHSLFQEETQRFLLNNLRPYD